MGYDPRMTNICGNCLKHDNPHYCSACNVQQYCSKSCQESHWKSHSKFCAETIADLRVPKKPGRFSKQSPESVPKFKWSTKMGRNVPTKAQFQRLKEVTKDFMKKNEESVKLYEDASIQFEYDFDNNLFDSQDNAFEAYVQLEMIREEQASMIFARSSVLLRRLLHGFGVNKDYVVYMEKQRRIVKMKTIELSKRSPGEGIRYQTVKELARAREEYWRVYHLAMGAESEYYNTTDTDAFETSFASDHYVGIVQNMTSIKSGKKDIGSELVSDIQYTLPSFGSLNIDGDLDDRPRLKRFLRGYKSDFSGWWRDWQECLDRVFETKSDPGQATDSDDDSDYEDDDNEAGHIAAKSREMISDINKNGNVIPKMISKFFGQVADKIERIEEGINTSERIKLSILTLTGLYIVATIGTATYSFTSTENLIKMKSERIGTVKNMTKWKEDLRREHAHVLIDLKKKTSQQKTVEDVIHTMRSGLDFASLKKAIFGSQPFLQLPMDTDVSIHTGEDLISISPYNVTIDNLDSQGSRDMLNTLYYQPLQLAHGSKMMIDKDDSIIRRALSTITLFFEKEPHIEFKQPDALSVYMRNNADDGKLASSESFHGTLGIMVGLKDFSEMMRLRHKVESGSFATAMYRDSVLGDMEIDIKGLKDRVNQWTQMQIEDFDTILSHKYAGTLLEYHSENAASKMLQEMRNELDASVDGLEKKWDPNKMLAEYDRMSEVIKKAEEEIPSIDESIELGTKTFVGSIGRLISDALAAEHIFTAYVGVGWRYFMESNTFSVTEYLDTTFNAAFESSTSTIDMFGAFALAAGTMAMLLMSLSTLMRLYTFLLTLVKIIVRSVWTVMEPYLTGVLVALSSVADRVKTFSLNMMNRIMGDGDGIDLYAPVDDGQSYARRLQWIRDALVMSGMDSVVFIGNFLSGIFGQIGLVLTSVWVLFGAVAILGGSVHSGQLAVSLAGMFTLWIARICTVGSVEMGSFQLDFRSWKCALLVGGLPNAMFQVRTMFGFASAFAVFITGIGPRVYEGIRNIFPSFLPFAGGIQLPSISTANIITELATGKSLVWRMVNYTPSRIKLLVGGAFAISLLLSAGAVLRKAGNRPEFSTDAFKRDDDLDFTVDFVSETESESEDSDIDYNDIFITSCTRDGINKDN